MIFAYGSSIKICGEFTVLTVGQKDAIIPRKNSYRTKILLKKDKGSCKKSSFLIGRATKRAGGGG